MNDFLQFDLFEQVTLNDNAVMRTNVINKFSLKKLMEIDTQEMIFKLIKHDCTKDCSSNEKKHYHEIKLSRLNDKIIVQIINISSKVIKEFDEK